MGKGAIIAIVFLLLAVAVGAFVFMRQQLPETADDISVVDTEIVDETPVPETNSEEMVVEGAINEVTVEGVSYSLTPATIRVKAGETVRLTYTSNEDGHDLVIDELNVRTRLLNRGESETVEFTPVNPGTYSYYCSVIGHRESGMVGTLIVE